MIDLHFVYSPNGTKVAILLEELGLEWRRIEYSIFEGRQLKPEFRALNPNNRLPVILDHAPDDGGPPHAVFESGAILLYLAEKHGAFLGSARRDRSRVQQWLMWQMAGLGPMQGQAHHFLRYAPSPIFYAIRRYINECNRLMDVMEHRLRESAYLAGPDYSIADIACWPWIRAGRILELDMRDRPSLQGWYDRIAGRPAVERAAELPASHMLNGPAMEKVALSDEQWSNLFGANLLAAARPAQIAGDPA